jgi:hypothetical protein
LELSRDQGIKVLFIEQGFLVGFAGILAIDTNTLAGEVLGQGSSRTGEGEFDGLLRSIAPGRGLFQTRRVDPGDGGCRHAEVQVIDDLTNETPQITPLTASPSMSSKSALSALRKVSIRSGAQWARLAMMRVSTFPFSR